MNSTVDTPGDSSHRLLAQVTTIWTNILQARGGPDEADAVELRRFFSRYHRPVVNYLQSCVRDEGQAADLFQEFALKFVRGDFRSMQVRTGSFRQYLKTALLNLIRDHSSRKSRSVQLTSGLEPATLDANWHANSVDQALRDELLGTAWAELEQAHQSRGEIDFPVLKERVQHPELTAEQLGSRLVEIGCCDSTPTDAHTRKLVQRAREEFADQLLAATSRMLGTTNWSGIEDELAQLGLLQYCERRLRERSTPAADRG